MKNFIKRKNSGDDTRPKIKIQLDYKTQVIVRSIEAFNKWKLLFPAAEIIV